MKDRREAILATASDLAANFLYYHRKEDEDLPRGAIEEAIGAGEISEWEILEVFAKGCGWEWPPRDPVDDAVAQLRAEGER